MLGLCSSAKKFSFETLRTGPIIFGGEKRTQKLQSSALCIACEFVMTEVDRLLDNKATEVSLILHTVIDCYKFLIVTVFR